MPKRPQVVIPGQRARIKIGGSKYDIVRERDRINIHGGKAGGLPPPSPRILEDYKEQIRRMIERTRAETGRFLGSVKAQRRFRKEGKGLSHWNEGAPLRATISFTGGEKWYQKRPVLRTKNVGGGGEISLKPWSSNFFLLHPVRLLTNVGRTMINPLTRRAIDKEAMESLGALKKTGVRNEMKQFQKSYEQRLNDSLRELRESHNMLLKSFEELEKGKITRARYEGIFNIFDLSRRRIEQVLKTIDGEYRQKTFELGRKAGKEREKKAALSSL